MSRRRYVSMKPVEGVDRRDFLKVLGTASAAAAGSAVFGMGTASAQETPPPAAPPPEVETNLADFTKVPKGRYAIPGPFPGKVVQVTDARSIKNDKVDEKVVAGMVEKGITTLTGKNMKQSFKMLFRKNDVVGIKINPIGPPLMCSKPEVVAALIAWLESNGIPRGNIVIWDRFEDMLKEAGYTAERFPGVKIEALQTMAEEGKSFKNDKGEHLSAANFDRDAFYFAKGVVGKGVRGYKDDEFYLNQHVVNDEYSYFGSLVTKRLTKIINVAVFKNASHGISMLTKNIGYGAICNTGRLHATVGFRVNTEVHAAPAVRDKLVLNVIDGIRGQYDDGPMFNEKFVYPLHTLYFATDPFAADRVGHDQIVEKRKAMEVKIVEHPRFTDYFAQAQKLGLGVTDPEKIKLVKVVV